MTDPVSAAIAAVGGVAELARAVGVSAPAAHQWRTGARAIPADRCPAIERATAGRVTCEELRPDVRWARLPDAAWPHPAGRPCIDVAAPAAGNVTNHGEARDGV